MINNFIININITTIIILLKILSVILNDYIYVVFTRWFQGYSPLIQKRFFGVKKIKLLLNLTKISY